LGIYKKSSINLWVNLKFFANTPKRQALAQYIAILLHNPGLKEIGAKASLSHK